MPQATEELRQRWHGPSEDYAMSYLAERGYTLDKNWEWVPPSPDHVPTDDEKSAVMFLIQEWDMGGIKGVYMTNEPKNHQVMR